MKIFFINLDFYNIFKLYFVFFLFYLFVFRITKISNNYRDNLNNNYDNKINEICSDLDDMYNEYRLFCKAQDNNFSKQTHKEYNKSKKYFQDLSDHIFNDIKSNIIVADQEILDMQKHIHNLVFDIDNNNNKSLK